MVKTGDQHAPKLKSLPVLRQQKKSQRLIAIRALQQLQPTFVTSHVSSYF
jgi:hypothetical protein